MFTAQENVRRCADYGAWVGVLMISRAMKTSPIPPAPISERIFLLSSPNRAAVILSFTNYL